MATHDGPAGSGGGGGGSSPSFPKRPAEQQPLLEESDAGDVIIGSPLKRTRPDSADEPPPPFAQLLLRIVDPAAPRVAARLGAGIAPGCAGSPRRNPFRPTNATYDVSEDARMAVAQQEHELEQQRGQQQEQRPRASQEDDDVDVWQAPIMQKEEQQGEGPAEGNLQQLAASALVVAGEPGQGEVEEEQGEEAVGPEPADDDVVGGPALFITIPMEKFSNNLRDIVIELVQPRRPWRLCAGPIAALEAWAFESGCTLSVQKEDFEIDVTNPVTARLQISRVILTHIKDLKDCVPNWEPTRATNIGGPSVQMRAVPRRPFIKVTYRLGKAQGLLFKVTIAVQGAGQQQGPNGQVIQQQAGQQQEGGGAEGGGAGVAASVSALAHSQLGALSRAAFDLLAVVHASTKNDPTEGRPAFWAYAATPEAAGQVSVQDGTLTKALLPAMDAAAL